MKFDLQDDNCAGHGQALTQVAWYEGLQLLPQHFQAWDARLDALLRRQRMCLDPYAWGLNMLEIDEQAFKGGVLSIKSVAGCFPDGLDFSWKAMDFGKLECALDPEPEPARYAIAVPAEDFSEKGQSIRRFKQWLAPPLTDGMNQDEKAAILRLLPNLSVMRWDPTNAAYVQIPMIEARSTPVGFELVEFHPPAPRLLRDSRCAAEVSSLVKMLRDKAQQLEVPALPSILSSDYRCGLGWVLSCLVGALPRLEAQMTGGVTHPYEIFLSLCAVSGSVAPLGGGTPKLFAAYEHLDPGSSICTVVGAVLRYVNLVNIRHSRWAECAFELVEGEWSVALAADQNRAELFVAVTFDPATPHSAVAAWVKHALICFADDKSRCQEARVRGLPRNLQTTAQPGLELAPGKCYIRIDSPPGQRSTERTLVVSSSDERSGFIQTSVSLLTLHG